MRLRPAVLIAAILFTSPSWAESFAATKAKLEAAMKAELRSDKEIQRDKNRLPLQTLEFFGLRDNMKVVEFIPGGGWYTKLLAPTLAAKGEYFAALGTGRIKDKLTAKTGFPNIKLVAEDAKFSRPEGQRLYSLSINDIGVKNADMVLTFRNYHNFNQPGRASMNKAAWDALKPGGTYAVVDHTARHMQAPNDSNRRRVDPVLAIKEIQAAGFELVDYSTLHYREDDELRYEVGAKSVSGNTDRWTIKFRKPK